MPVTAFEGPDGELTLEPTIDALRPLLAEGNDYWDGGSGSALLGQVELLNPGYRNRFDLPVLHVVGQSPYGFSLCYSPGASQPEVNLLSFDATADASLVVVHNLGGEPTGFARSSFVPRAVAEQVIADFLADASRPSSVVEWRARTETEIHLYTHKEPSNSD